MQTPSIKEISTQQLRQILQLQRDLLSVVAGTTPARERIDTACRVFEQAVPQTIASVMSLNADGLLEVIGGPSMSSAMMDELNGLKPGPGAGSCGNAVFSAQSVFVENTRTDPRWQDLRNLAIDYDLGACWSMPIWGRNHRILGSFALTSLTQGMPSPLQQEILALGASVMLLLLEQVREERIRHEREEEIRRLSDFNALLASASDLITRSTDERQLLQEICDLAVSHTGLKLIWIGKPKSDGFFDFLAASGDARSYIETLDVSIDPGITEGQGPCGQTWRDGRSMFHGSFSQTPALAHWRKRAEKLGIAASCSLPIDRQDQRWGILTVYHQQPDIFDTRLQRVLESLAMSISRGLDRLDLLDHERQARQSQALLANALHAVQEGVIITDPEQNIVYVNDAFSTMTGFEKDEVLGQNCRFLQGPDTSPSIKTLIGTRLEQGQSFSGEILNYHKDGTAFWNLLTITPLLGDNNRVTHFVGVQRDITDLRSLNSQLEHQALHDELTGLPNRRALEVQINDSIARADRTGSVMAVAIIDLDDFKPVNDSLGHSAGDELLKQISERFLHHLDQGEYVARIGGDEFIMIFEDLEAAKLDQAIEAFTQRVHRAVETPFSICANRPAFYISMSMGIACYPQDGQDGGVLLRLADGALYATKSHKHERPQWWQRHGVATDSILETEDHVDAYGLVAVEVLTIIEDQLQTIADNFLHRFYGSLKREPALRRILDTLTDEQLSQFKQRLVSHLCHVLRPHTSYTELETNSRDLGRSCLLTGLDSVMLLQILALFRQMLSEYLNGLPMRARQRYRVQQVAEQRLQDDMRIQLTTHNRIQDKFVDYTVQPMPERLGSWSDAVAHEIGVLGNLPGIRAALLIRQSSQGVFKIEAQAGPQAREIADTLRLTGIEINETSLLPGKDSRIASAWQSSQVQSSPSHAKESRTPEWDAFFEKLIAAGAASSCHIPILDELGHSVAVISLMGAYANQFESNWFRQFTRNLQQRWGEIWLRCSQPAPAVSQALSIAYRQRLFEGGLQMYMQPIIDLESGQLIKVEALARLLTLDDRLLGPGTFLPLLGDAELNRLFRLGLEQALSWIRQWETQGLVLSVSVNLPPRTLLDPECPAWVEKALSEHGVAPERLALELLESQEIDDKAKDAAIKRLINLGVKLAMDDLGSGFSSLHRLASVPFDMIKVDQGLLARIRTEPRQTLSLMASVIQMGRDFERNVIVEGLEDEGMIEAARILGGHYGQGYGLARPMPPENLPHWARTFKLPVHRQRITTPLGALAFHWRTVHRGSHEESSLEDCPLTHYLVHQGLANSQLAQLHEQLHQGQPSEEASKRLLNALVSLVQG